MASTSISEPAPAEGQARRAAQLKWGFVVCGIGLAGFFPALLTAVFSEPYRIAGALLTFFFWLVWFAGKTMVKVARTPQ